VALFQLESSSNEEMEFERVRFREFGCGCSYGCLQPTISTTDYGHAVNPWETHNEQDHAVNPNDQNHQPQIHYQPQTSKISG
jgi:hypothetical protein